MSIFRVSYVSRNRLPIFVHGLLDLRACRLSFPFPVCVPVSFGGKLHIGFVDIRNKLESILEEREAKRVKRREEEEKVGSGRGVGGGGGGGRGRGWE